MLWSKIKNLNPNNDEQITTHDLMFPVLHYKIKLEIHKPTSHTKYRNCLDHKHSALASSVPTIMELPRTLFFFWGGGGN